MINLMDHYILQADEIMPIRAVCWWREEHKVSKQLVSSMLFKSSEASEGLPSEPSPDMFYPLIFTAVWSG